MEIFLFKKYSSLNMRIYYCNAKTLLAESLFLQGMEYVDGVLE